jgi:hypothetical protein
MEHYKNLSLDNINEEIWKVLFNENNEYSISNFGRVKSSYRKLILSDGKVITISEKILKQSINKFGYLAVAFSKSKKLTSFIVHRLVGLYFIENKNNLKQINHIDGIRTNNKLENLEWVSNMENSCHRFQNLKKSSKFIGVSFCKKLNKWRTKIYFNKKQVHLGVFNCEIEAHLKRVDFEKLNGIINNYNIK